LSVSGPGNTADRDRAIEKPLEGVRQSGELTTVLPVYSIAGIGTYEAGVVAALVPADIGYQEAIKTAVNLHLFFCPALYSAVS
jgi:hypothetical protein